MKLWLPLAVTVGISALEGCAAAHSSRQAASHSSQRLFDPARQRPIVVEVYLPEAAATCTKTHRCPTALLSAGYGIDHGHYSFAASALTELGYLVVSVQQELPSDPPLPTEGDLFAARTPNWQRGAANLRFVVQALRDTHPEFDWERPMLIGHSNGGDISAWLVRESPDFAGALVTLDSRRVPLPRTGVPRVLSIRAEDFPADDGVLPSLDERRTSGACIVTLAGAHHDEMHDGGPAALRQRIARSIRRFLSPGECSDGSG